MTRKNSFGQPIGAALQAWTPPPAPLPEVHEGRWCRLEPLHVADHASALFEANAEDDGRMWTYLPYGPFPTRELYSEWLAEAARGEDPRFFAIRDRDSGQIGGLASYLRIQSDLGSIEVGHLAYAPCLQRTRAGTEAMYLLMRHAFELGYRRYEWKCDALNAPSMRAAKRYGFRFEGTFRSAAIYKGRSRDTGWFSIVDEEWPAVRACFEAWLEPENFDGDAQQRQPLVARKG